MDLRSAEIQPISQSYQQAPSSIFKYSRGLTYLDFEMATSVCSGRVYLPFSLASIPHFHDLFPRLPSFVPVSFLLFVYFVSEANNGMERKDEK